jgi:hypothetical protein
VNGFAPRCRGFQQLKLRSRTQARLAFLDSAEADR